MSKFSPIQYSKTSGSRKLINSTGNRYFVISVHVLIANATHAVFSDSGFSNIFSLFQFYEERLNWYDTKDEDE
jgi:hypothetical protein